MTNLQKNWPKIWLAIAAVIFISAFAARFFFPMEIYELSNRFELWRAGVHEFHENGLSGLLRDACDPADPEARGCTCVALIHGLGDEPMTWRKLLVAPKKAWSKPVKLYAIAMKRSEEFIPGDRPENYRARVQADTLANALAPICPKWVLVGNSLGGWISAWIALDGKLPVEKLVLVDSAGLRGDASTNTSAGLFLSPTADHVREIFRRIYYKPLQIPEDAWGKITEHFVHADLGDILKAQTEEDFLDGRLQYLRVPTMVVWGAGDHLIPSSLGKEMRSMIPSSIWREIPECGHIPQKECPVSLIQGIDDMLRVGAM
jgi:pimeloyl-ACP methyl ester carboxylesterase